MSNTKAGIDGSNAGGTIPDSSFQNPYAGGSNFKKRTIIEGSSPSEDTYSQQPQNSLVGFLVSFSKLDTGEYWDLREGNNNIGTSQENNILLNEIHVSSNHAKLNISKDVKSNRWKFQLVDLSASNGTFINGERIDIYTGYSLSENDKIKIGEYEFILVVADKFIHNLAKNPNFKPLQSYDYSSQDLYNDNNDYTRPA